MNRQLRLGLWASIWVAGALGAEAHAQTIDEAGITLRRLVTPVFDDGVNPAAHPNNIYGLDVDQQSGIVVFIGDSGTDIFALDTIGLTYRIFENIGQFTGQRSDIKINPFDGLIYAISSTSPSPVDVYDFSNLNNPIDKGLYTTISGGSSNAFGYDFDCLGRLYASETGTALWRIGTDRVPEALTAGWTADGISFNNWIDIEEIEASNGVNVFVFEGNTTNDDNVYVVGPDGVGYIYATGFGTAITGAYDASTGDLIVLDNDTNEIFRLHDADNDGTIVGDEATEQTLIAHGLSGIIDMSVGPSSDGASVYSLYLARQTQRQIYELKGLGVPPAFAGCGNDVDDDGDGFCEDGTDLDGDRICDDADGNIDDCNDDRSDEDAVDANVGVSEADFCDATLVDNDCDGLSDDVDPDCADVFDQDGDGFCVIGADNNHDGFCEAQFAQGDCDDTDPARYPRATEICETTDSHKDNDCDGALDIVDTDCSEQQDIDGDGVCVSGQDLNFDGYCETQNGAFDCNEADPSTHSNQTEICNQAHVDNDCDNDPDNEDADCDSVFDTDGDGFCPTGQDTNSDGFCETQDGSVDCNDTNSLVYPGANENCTDGVDNNCNGDTDLSDAACNSGSDDDGDGYCPVGIDLNHDGDCTDINENVSTYSDCLDDSGDPNSASVNSEATEGQSVSGTCNDGYDNECDGQADGNDPDCPDYTDMDGDGYCVIGQDLNLDGDCSDEDEDAQNPDCDDSHAEINPGATEICDNDVDEDCDMILDDDDVCLVPDGDGGMDASMSGGSNGNTGGAGNGNGSGNNGNTSNGSGTGNGSGTDAGVDSISGEKNGGCGCEVDAQPTTSTQWLLFGLLAWALRLRRRKR